MNANDEMAIGYRGAMSEKSTVYPDGEPPMARDA